MTDVTETRAERRARGLAKMAEVYNFPIDYPEELSGFQQATVEHLFADIWSRPGLSIRDRRLVLIGITAMLGNEEIMKIQLGSALDKGELDPQAIEEIVLTIAHYGGWPLSTVVNRVAKAVIAERAPAPGS